MNPHPLQSSAHDRMVKYQDTERLRVSSPLAVPPVLLEGRLGGAFGGPVG